MIFIEAHFHKIYYMYQELLKIPIIKAKYNLFVVTCEKPSALTAKIRTKMVLTSSPLMNAKELFQKLFMSSEIRPTF